MIFIPSASHISAYIALIEEDEPTLYKQFVNQLMWENGNPWYMDEEMESLQKNDIGKLHYWRRGMWLESEIIEKEGCDWTLINIQGE